MRSGGSRRSLHLTPPSHLTLLLPLLLSLAPSALGAATARPDTWRLLSELPNDQKTVDPVHVTAIGDPSDHPGDQYSQHHQRRSQGGQHGQLLHEPASISHWSESVPSHLINWEHPKLRAGDGGAPLLPPAFSLATLTDGSQGTSDVIKAITQYQLVRHLMSPYSNDEQDGVSDVTQEDRCACGRADFGITAGPSHLLDMVKASAMVALSAGLTAALSSPSLFPLAAGRRRRSTRSLADTACDVTARTVGVGFCGELKQVIDQLMTVFEESPTRDPSTTAEHSTGRRQERSLPAWSSPGRRLGRTVRRMTSRLSELTSSALRPLRTALRRWSSLLGPSRSGVAASRGDQQAAGGARPARRLYSPGCDCGAWARQGFLGGGPGVGLTSLLFTASYWVPVLGLVFLLGQIQNQNRGDNTASYSPDDKDTVSHSVDINLTNTPSNSQESSQDNADDTGTTMP